MKKRDELNRMIRYAQRLMEGVTIGITEMPQKVLMSENTYKIKKLT